MHSYQALTFRQLQKATKIELVTLLTSHVHRGTTGGNGYCSVETFSTGKCSAAVLPSSVPCMMLQLVVQRALKQLTSWHIKVIYCILRAN